MKVLLVNQIPEVNNKYTFSLARALKKREVDIAVCGIADDDVSSYRDIKYAGIFHPYSKESNPLKKVISYYKSWKRIFQYCEKNEIDIVHVQWYIFSPLDWHFHKKLRQEGIKVVTTIHDLLPFDKKFYDFYFHKKIYSKSDAVISQALMNREKLLEKFGVEGEKIYYVPHGHYMEFAEKAGFEESRKHLDIPFDKKVVLFFGQIKKVKGVGVLIKAMKKVAEVHKDVLCLISGKVWKDDFAVYADLINELGIGDYIRTEIKYIDDDDIKYYFNAADIVALPYLQVYQSGVVQLAYAYEKPVVATETGEFISVVKNQETGILVPPGDSDSLADAICWYLDNPDAAREYGIKGKEDLSVRLSWDNIAGEIKSIYNKVKYNE